MQVRFLLSTPNTRSSRSVFFVVQESNLRFARLHGAILLSQATFPFIRESPVIHTKHTEQVAPFFCCAGISHKTHTNCRRNLSEKEQSLLGLALKMLRADFICVLRRGSPVCTALSPRKLPFAFPLLRGRNLLSTPKNTAKIFQQYFFIYCRINCHIVYMYL